MQSSQAKQSPGESKLIPAYKIYESHRKTRNVVRNTPMIKSDFLSTKYNANIYLKREDLQAVRSFKIRGAANAIRSLTEEERKKGVVTASAGNHAQGVAYCCNQLKIKGAIFMPIKSPQIKVNSVRHWGRDYVTIYLIGNTFDEALAEARKYEKEHGSVFVHAFDNPLVVEGQGGIAVQLLESWQEPNPIDYVVCCVGGGGLMAGIASYMKQMSPATKIVGAEPLGCPSMMESLKKGEIVALTKIDTFVDGAAVGKPGIVSFGILKELGLDIKLVPEGMVCQTILELYNMQAIVLEPAGALSVAALESMKEDIAGKNVICVLSGSNNDISRLPEIRLRSKLYQELQAYYTVSLGQNPGKIREFVLKVVNTEEEDLIMMNYSRKYFASGECLVGVEFFEPKFKNIFEERMTAFGYKFTILLPGNPMFQLIIR